MKKNLRYFMTLLLMMVASVGWAEDVTIATATFNGKNATYTEGWTTTGTGKTRTDCVVIGAGENITSPTFDLTEYSTVTISFKARRFGNLTGSKATVDVSISGTSVGTIDITGTNATNNAGDITFSPTSSMTAASLVFTCTNATSAGSTHGAGIGTITIVGTKGGTITYDSDLTLSPTSVELDLAGTKTQDLSITTSSTGAITWTSNNPDVATVDNTGKVEAVAVGTATITASQAADATYRAGEATCAVTVIDSESTEQTVSFVAGTDKGTMTGATGSQGEDVATKGEFSISTSNGALAANPYRIYKNATITVSSTSSTIKKIEYSIASGYKSSDLSGDDYSDGIWTGSSKNVTLTASAQVRISSIKITYEPLDETVSASPVISGTTPFLTSTNVTITAAEGASIYYTTDGTDPSESSTKYTAPFSISATTTVKAIAVEEGKSASEISEETFTKTESYTLGEINSKDAGKYFVNFDNAVVTYVNGSYTFIQDNSGAVLYYKSNGGYTEGQVLNGIASVDFYVYDGQPEITTITREEGMTVTNGTAIEPTVVTLASLVDNSTTYISKYVKVEGVEATSTSELSQNGTTLAFYGRNGAAIEEGKQYDIIGFLGNHKGTYQLTAYTTDHVKELAEDATITISSAGQATFSSTKTYAIPEGLTAYVVTAYSKTDNNVTLTPLTSVIPANTGVVVKGNAGTYELTESSESKNIETNYLKANVTPYNLPAEEVIDGENYYNYTLAADGFKHSSGEGILAAGKAYLQIPYNVPATDAKLSLVFDGEGTGINNVNANDNANNKIFNLSGQRVGASFKGLVIKNGKKYINK